MQKVGFMVKCKLCEKEFYTTPLKISKGRGKYCSMSCRSKIAIYKSLAVRRKNTPEDNKRISEFMRKRFKDETKHPRWKGDDVGYFGLHDWIEKHYGRPKECEVCGLNDPKRKYHWANLTNYKRDRNDFKRMCVSCHRKYDYRRKNKKLEITP